MSYGPGYDLVDDFNQCSAFLTQLVAEKKQLFQAHIKHQAQVAKNPESFHPLHSFVDFAGPSISTHSATYNWLVTALEPYHNDG